MPISEPAGSAFGASGRAYKSHKLRGQQLCIAGERHDNTTLWQREHVTEAGADRTAVGLQLGYDILGQYVIVIPSEAQRPLLMARAKGR